jgi:hypothetical protein
MARAAARLASLAPIQAMMSVAVTATVTSCHSTGPSNNDLQGDIRGS